MPAATSPPRRPRTRAAHGHDTRPTDPRIIANALAVLDSNGGNVSRSARELNMPATTLSDWAKGRRRTTAKQPEVVARVETLREAKRDQLQEAMDDIAWQAAQQVTDTLHEAKARDAAVVMGIAVDKGLTLRGMPNVIHGQAHPTLSQLSPDQLRALRAILAGEVPTVVDAPALPAAPLDPTATMPALVPPRAVRHEGGAPLLDGGQPEAELVQGETERARETAGRVQGRLVDTGPQFIQGLAAQPGARGETREGQPVLDTERVEQSAEGEG